MIEKTEANFYNVDGINGSEEITIAATIRDYRGDEWLQPEKRTVDCYEIIRIITTVFSVDFREASVDACGIFMEATESYLSLKWGDIEKMVADAYIENNPVAEEIIDKIINDFTGIKEELTIICDDFEKTKE